MEKTALDEIQAIVHHGPRWTVGWAGGTRHPAFRWNLQADRHEPASGAGSDHGLFSSAAGL